MWITFDVDAEVDPLPRLMVATDAYGDRMDRSEFPAAFEEALTVGRRFVERRVNRGHSGFIDRWEQGGRYRAEARRTWLARNYRRLLNACGP